MTMTVHSQFRNGVDSVESLRIISMKWCMYFIYRAIDDSFSNHHQARPSQCTWNRGLQGIEQVAGAVMNDVSNTRDPKIL